MIKKIVFLIVFFMGGFSTANAALYRPVQSKGLPLCDDAALLRMFAETAHKEKEKDTLYSVMDKRNNTLFQRDIQSFKEVSIKQLDRKNDYKVLDKLMDVKINKGIVGDSLRLCKSTSNGPTKELYLLIYRYQYSTVVDVVNFPNSLHGLSFNYD